MSTLSDLYSKKRKYKNLKESIENIINYLEISINNIENVSSRINSCYQIDGEKADKGKLSELNSELQEKKNGLKNTIYPAINNKIYELENQIIEEESV